MSAETATIDIRKRTLTCGICQENHQASDRDEAMVWLREHECDSGSEVPA